MHIHQYLILFLFFIFQPLQAAHIVGGELTYTRSSLIEYDFTMIVYRDCFANGAGFDSSNSGAVVGTITIFRDGVLREIISLEPPTVSSIDLNESAHPCPENTGLCVEKGVYDFSAFLPLTSGTYTITYQRCCRNSTVMNIPSPEETGMTFTIDVSEEAQTSNNSSPTFSSVPTPLVCVNEPMSINTSALDLDGDELRYSFCSPFIGGGLAGATGNGNATDILGFAPSPDAPPPYNTIDYIAPIYTASNPLAGNPPIIINPSTGMVTGTPNIIGQFIFSVCVEEYKNNILISTIRREYQLNVADCDPSACATNSTNNYESDNNSLEIFPNPTQGMLKVSIAEQSISSWKLFDLKGSLVKYSDKSNGDINLMDLSSGLYFLQLKDEHGNFYREKVVKL